MFTWRNCTCVLLRVNITWSRSVGLDPTTALPLSEMLVTVEPISISLLIKSTGSSKYTFPSSKCSVIRPFAVSCFFLNSLSYSLSFFAGVVCSVFVFFFFQKNGNLRCASIVVAEATTNTASKRIFFLMLVYLEFILITNCCDI